MSMASILRIPFFRAREVRNPKTQEISGLDFRSAVAAFEGAGFWVLREGLHVIMTDGNHILTIPCQDPVNALTMEGLARDAGLSPERFRRLL
jgi:hypothetical protein